VLQAVERYGFSGDEAAAVQDLRFRMIRGLIDRGRKGFHLMIERRGLSGAGTASTCPEYHMHLYKAEGSLVSALIPAPGSGQ